MHKPSGFSLLELAVSLIVIGLITGAVLAGQSLLKNQRMQSVMAELDSNIKAIRMFQEKYTALPGDMPSAAALWGTAAGGCPNGARSGTQTCSGDGNGLIVSDYTADPYEMYEAWYQLALAELMDVQLSGTGTGWGALAGTNVPQSRLQQNAGWLIYYVGNRSGDAEFFNGFYGHVLMLAANGRSTSENAGIMSAVDLYNLDLKFDDGIIATGTIRGTKNATDGFVSACENSLVPATYNTTVGDPTCAPVFITGF